MVADVVISSGSVVFQMLRGDVGRIGQTSAIAATNHKRPMPQRGMCRTSKARRSSTTASTSVAVRLRFKSPMKKAVIAYFPPIASIIARISAISSSVSVLSFVNAAMKAGREPENDSSIYLPLR